MEGRLTKLVISPCAVETNGKVTVDKSVEFEALINPSAYSHKHAIRYDMKKTLGQLAPQTEFSAVDGEKVSFDLVLDGTGVVPPSRPTSEVISVTDQVDTLKKVTYEYDGDDHQPRPVRALWGTMKFFGRLTSLDVDYSLFKPSGEPLRAKVKLAFTGFMSAEEESLRANRSSPDLTHIVTVSAGDTLPLLCYRIYRDTAYYPQVARHNGLVSVRRLKPGTRLHFPPLE